MEFPLFAFTHCRDVVAAVCNAGGFGVLGAVKHTPGSLEIELNWINKHVDGKPYGVDLLIPNKIDAKGEMPTVSEVEARIPPEHRAYISKFLVDHGLDVDDLWRQDNGAHYGENFRPEGAKRLLDVAFAHLIKLVVNALSVPPVFMMEQARGNGVAVGALTGARKI